MAKLLIYRGESLLEERELTGQTLKIGRAAQNDIVLEDPGKGVSREHAELRFEGGRYTLVDRQSQNGIWVSGARVPSVVLDRDVIAAVGPYRLTVKADPIAVAPPLVDDTPVLDVPVADVPVADVPVAGVPVADVPVADVPIEDVAAVRIPERAAEPAPSESSAAPLDLNDLAPPPTPAPLPPPAPARVATSTASSQRVPKAPPPPAPKTSVDPRVIGIAVAVVVLVGLSGFIGYKLMHKVRPPGPSFDVNIAQSLVNSGRCAEALEKQINPALAQLPNDETWRKLRDQCAAPQSTSSVPPTTSVPDGPTVAQLLDEAEKQIAAKDCQTALTGINAALAQAPDDPRAKDLLAKATACSTVASVTTTVAVEVLPPSKGGLPKLPRESDKDHKERMAKATQAYDDAVQLVQTRKYLQARRAFDDLAAQVPPDYRDLAQRRDELAKTIVAEAKGLFMNAQRVDRALVDRPEDFEAATIMYQRAHDLDPTLPAEAAIRALNERRTTIGKDKCNKGLVEFSVGNNAGALPLLQDAVKLLSVSQSEQCYGRARQALQAMGK